MPAMWDAPRLGTTWRLRSLKISSCAVAKESAQAGRTLALFSLSRCLSVSWQPVVVPDLEAVRHVLRESSGGTSWDG